MHLSPDDLPLPCSAHGRRLKTFRSLVVLKRPQPELWAGCGIICADFAGQIADIEEIREIERTTDSRRRGAYRERVAREATGPRRDALDPEDQRTELDRSQHLGCQTPSAPGPSSPLSDRTHRLFRPHQFADAMAGQGTSVTFEGEFDLKPGLLGSLGSMESPASGFLESIVTTVIPRNLRAVVEAALRSAPAEH